MDKFAKEFNSSFSIMYFNDTKTFSISNYSVIEKYKESVKVDLAKNTISYLGKSMEFSKDIPYKEIFYAAIEAYIMINKKSNSY